MDIYIYSDESGVFDKAHNNFFVFGGVMFLNKEDRDSWSRRYIAAEGIIRSSERIGRTEEVKASNISNKSKGKLYRSLNQVEKFGLVVLQDKLMDSVFSNKKSKQRYLDWGYKMAVKEKLVNLMIQGKINAEDVRNLFFYVDEHNTATNGLYELKESLEQEFKVGTHNFEYMTFHPPIFPHLQSVNVKYCNSATSTLVRAADIVANNIYHKAIVNSGLVSSERLLYIKRHP